MKLIFHPEAREEFLAAAEYYDSVVPGLGSRFLVAVRRATDIVIAHPEAGNRQGATIRRVLVSGFPYDIVYHARGDAIELLAVAHHHRRPGYWRNRRS